MIQAWETIFPIITMKVDDKAKVAHLARFLGCGFFINKFGFLLTCAHVINEASIAGEYLGVQNMMDGKRYFVHVIAKDDERDIAICRINSESFFKMEVDYERKVCGIDVCSFGLTIHEVVGPDIGLDMTFFKGYICGIPKIIPFFPDLTRTYLLSYPVLKGFSGAPLICNEKVCGMLYENKTSQVVDHHVKEIKDGLETYSEKVSRIYEFGMAHPIDILLEYVKKSGIEI